MVHETLFHARDLAFGGHYDDALQAYRELLQRNPDVATRAQIANDQGVIAAVTGKERLARVRFRQAQAIDSNHQATRENGRMLDHDDAMRSSHGPTRVAILSLLLIGRPPVAGRFTHWSSADSWLGAATTCGIFSHAIPLWESAESPVPWAIPMMFSTSTRTPGQRRMYVSGFGGRSPSLTRIG